MSKMKVIASLFAALLTCGASHVAADTTGRILSPYPVGGAVDPLARSFAEEFSNKLGKPFIVEQKTGAGGKIALDAFKKVAPDGDTVLIAAETNMVVYPNASRTPTYAAKDFIPIAIAAAYDIGIAVRLEPNVTNFASWLAQQKKASVPTSFGHPGVGSNIHVFGLMFAEAVGVKMEPVAYRGMQPAVLEVGAGDLPMVIGPVGTLLQHHRDKRLRIIATSGAQRSAKLPDVPTLAELGYPKLTQTGWFGFFAPGGTPPDKVTRIHAVISEGLMKPEVRARIDTLDMQIKLLSQQEFAKQVTEENTKWRAIIKAMDFSIE